MRTLLRSRRRNQRELASFVIEKTLQSDLKTCESFLKMKKFLLLVICVQFAQTVIGRHYRDSSFLHHAQLVYQFQCSLPQLRAVRVEDLLTAGIGPDEVFYPASTVLARCAASGCCPDSKQVCAPIETKNVSLVFLIRHRVDQQRDRHHEVIHAVEHTKCACMDEVLAANNDKL